MVRHISPGSSTTDDVDDRSHFDNLARSQVPVLGLDPEGRLVAWNEASSLQLGLDDDARGRALTDVLGTTTRELAALTLGAPCEVRATTPAGTGRLALLPIPLNDDDGPALALLLHAWLGEAVGGEAPVGVAGITSREREVMKLLAAGKSTVAIAGALGIARTTARNHIQAILGKLEAHSRLEAVARARELGLV